jgi:hypothetical protein
LLGVLCQHLSAVLCQHLFGILCQHLFRYYVSIFWGIISASVWVWCQHLFGYLVSVCLDIISAFVRESISWLLHLFKKFTGFYRMFSLKLAIDSYSVPHESILYYHLFFELHIMLSTSDNRFGLSFGLSDENNVL